MSIYVETLNDSSIVRHKNNVSWIMDITVLVIKAWTIKSLIINGNKLQIFPLR